MKLFIQAQKVLNIFISFSRDNASFLHAIKFILRNQIKVKAIFIKVMTLSYQYRKGIFSDMKTFLVKVLTNIRLNHYASLKFYK